jgi:hypothetical protein
MRRGDAALLDAINNTNRAVIEMAAALTRLDAKLDAGFERITTRLDEFHAEFALHRHGDEGEVE